MRIINPPALHDPVPFGYSHVVTSAPGELVFVAGQYAADETGAITSPDFADQVARSFENLGVALEAAGVGFADVMHLRTYIANHAPERLYALGAVLQEIWGQALPAQTLTGVASLALPEMQFEVDAIAVKA